METKILVPRAITEAAEQLAADMDVSLSDIYAAALKAYIAANRDISIIESLNTLYGEEPSQLDPELAQMQTVAIGETW